MKTVQSADGTAIAFDQLGKGPALILVGGALEYRAMDSETAQLAPLMAEHFTVFHYDRRGRGDSTDTQPYAVEREIEDIDALITEAGGSAFIFGISSGAALALEAAIKLGEKVKKLAMYEAPYNDEEAARQAWKAYRKQLADALAHGRRGDALALFMLLVGMPADHLDRVRQHPLWPMWEAAAPTLAYDAAVMGEDASVPTEKAAHVAIPALVMDGSMSYPFMHITAMALANAIPNGQHRTLEGQTHEVAVSTLAPVLVEFFNANTAAIGEQDEQERISREGVTHNEGDETHLHQRTGESMETITSNVTSPDGTRIAYDKIGHGPAVILVAGAFCARSFWSGPQLAKLLAPGFTVYNYDRRGRGDSGDTQPYAVAREIEDIEALIDQAGGSAYLYGHSSGAALALEAAVRLDTKVKKLAMYEAPYREDAQAKRAWRQYITQLTELLAADRRGDAAALFMKSTGMPDEQLDQMRHAPVWPMFEALAPTLAYDHTAILGEEARVPIERAAMVTTPTLIMYGTASYPFMADTAQALGKAIPHAQVRPLEGQDHNVASEALAPVLEEFFNADPI